MSSFLVHPIGEKLSSVTIDKLILPREMTHDYSFTPQSSSSPPSIPNNLVVRCCIVLGVAGLTIVPKNVKWLIGRRTSSTALFMQLGLSLNHYHYHVILSV